MATTAQLTALQNDGVFRARARNLILQQAAVVYNEGTGVTNHAARAAYAVKLLQTPSLADQLVTVLVNRTNLLNSVITYDFDKGEVLTDATDAAIASQIATDFSMFAGV